MKEDIRKNQTQTVSEVADSLRVVSFKVLPGFTQRMSTLRDTRRIDDPLWVKPDVPLDELMRFTHETGVQWSERTPNLLLRQLDYDDFIRTGGMHHVFDKLRGARVLADVQEDVWTAIAEVHHPGVKDCQAQLEHEEAATVGFSGEIKLFGWGGGADAETTVELTRGITLVKPGCVEVLLPLTVRAQLVESRLGKSTHIDIVGIREGPLGTRPLSGTKDRCGLAEQEVHTRGWRLVPFSLPGGHGTSSYEEKMGSERGFNGSAGIEVGGLKATIEASVKWVQSVKWAYTLALGRKYLGYRPNYATGLLWSRDRSTLR